MQKVELIEPVDLYQLIQSADTSCCLLDVRQPEEFELGSIPGAVLVPLMELESRLNELDVLSKQGQNMLVVYCRSGGRSERAIQFLQSRGYRNLRNLRGGINAYAKEADFSLSPY